jgi:putative Mn2+ efflux pump MntP
MLGLILVALGVGAGNFAVSIAIGLRGVDAKTRIRVGLVFGCFEGGMPVLGAYFGRGIAGHIGGAAHIAGGALLVAIGCYEVWSTRRKKKTGQEGASEPISTTRLLVTALALSVDNFVAGLALGALPISLALVAIVIASVSAAMSLLGLEIARHLGPLIEERAEIFGGVVLGGVGIALMSGVLS